MTTENTDIEARAVVIASGAFQVPRIPAISAAFSPEVRQLTATSYRNPSQVPAGTVLVTPYCRRVRSTKRVLIGVAVLLLVVLVAGFGYLKVQSERSVVLPAPKGP